MEQSTLTSDADSATGTRVVHKGNDGLWLNFNPRMHGGIKGGSMQHVHGVSGRPATQTGWIDTCDIGGCRCKIHRLEARPKRFDIAVMNPWGVRRLLLSAQGKLHCGFGYGGLNVRVHPLLIELLGEKKALEAARKWANSLGFCLPTLHDIALCERVSRIDYAVDVLVEKGGPDDYAPGVHEQLISKLQNREVFWETGWAIGLRKADKDGSKKDRLELVIVSYDKLRERWDKGGLEGLQEYVESLNEPSLVVHRDGRVTDVDGKEVRVWRVEFRFHRSFLHGEGIADASEAIVALPALVAAACRATRLHQRCTTGNVFRTNPLTRIWSLVQKTVT